MLGDPKSIGLPDVSANDAALNSAIAGVFIVIGAVAVLFLVLGGIRYIVAEGDASKIQKAKNSILYAVIGLIISVSGFVIVQFVAESISK